MDILSKREISGFSGLQLSGWLESASQGSLE
jgi:hypothetical protein